MQQFTKPYNNNNNNNNNTNSNNNNHLEMVSVYEVP